MMQRQGAIELQAFVTGLPAERVPLDSAQGTRWLGEVEDSGSFARNLLNLE